MILSKTQFPKIYSDNLDYGDLRFVVNSSSINVYKSLANKNMISFDYMRLEETWVFNYVHYNCQLTLEGEKYKMIEFTEEEKTIYKVKTAIEDFGEITGIKESEDGKSASVEYTTLYTTVTPFGEILGNGRFQQGRTQNHTALLSKYDDGWRISN